MIIKHFSELKPHLGTSFEELEEDSEFLDLLNNVVSFAKNKVPHFFPRACDLRKIDVILTTQRVPRNISIEDICRIIISTNKRYEEDFKILWDILNTPNIALILKRY